MRSTLVVPLALGGGNSKQLHIWELPDQRGDRIVSAFDIALAATAGLVVLEILVFPYRRCRNCDGSGKIFSPLNPTTNWRNCPDCRGSGKKLRFLAWLVRALSGRD